jgi:hypothetical protein
VNIEVSYEDNGRMDAYIEILNNPIEFIGTVATRIAEKAKAGILSDFSQEPSEPNRKIKFTSAQQRKKVFAARLHGPRSHALSQGWKVEVIPDAYISSIVITNPAPETIYVVGKYQQRWHKETGWYYVPDLAAKWSIILIKEGNEELSQAWTEVHATR